MGSEEAAGPLAPWLGFLRGIEQQCQGAFYAWGKIVVGNARAVQAVWLLVVVVCAGLGFGAVGVHFEDDPTKLWVIEDSISVEHNRYVLDKYSSGVGALSMCFTGKVEPHDDGRDLAEDSMYSSTPVLSDAFVTAAHAWDAKIRSRVVECVKGLPNDPTPCADDQIGLSYSYEDVCFRPSGPDSPCYVLSPLELLKAVAVDMDPLIAAMFASSNATCSTVAAGGMCGTTVAALAGLELQAVCPVSCDHTMSKLETLQLYDAIKLVSWDFDSLFGLIERGDAPINSTDLLGFPTLHGPILGARAVRATYLLACDDAEDGRCKNWERKVLDWLATEEQREAAYGDGIYFYGIGFEAQKAELQRGSNEVNPLFGVATTLMIFYVVWTLFKTKESSYYSMGVVGWQSIMCIQFSFAWSFGLTAVFGIMFSAVTPVCGFLLLAVGTDDVFIICSILDQMPKDLDAAERVARALAHAGPAILITTSTSAIAFFAGSAIRFPAMQAFCLDAAIGIICVFFTACSAVTACIAVHESRSSPFDQWVDQKRGSNKDAADVVANESADSSGWRGFWLQRWGPLVAESPLPAKIGVIVAFLVVTMLSAWQATNVRLQFVIADVFPDNSYIPEWLSMTDHYFPTQLFTGGVYLKAGLDYELPTTQQKLAQMVSSIESSRWVESEVDSWLSRFLEWRVLCTDGILSAVDCAGYVSSNSFNRNLRAFVETPYGQDNKNDIIWDIGAGTDDPPASTRLKFSHPAWLASEASDQEDCVAEMRELVAASGLDAFPFAQDYVFWEVWSMIVTELRDNLLTSLLCIFLCCNLLLLHPFAAVALTIMVAMAECMLLAYMATADVALNSVTLAICVMSVGLIVDYCAHIMHQFMLETGSLQERTKLCIANMGTGVFCGATTTFLGFIPILFATFEVGRVFAKMFFGIIGIGISIAFILLPISLSLIGPAPNMPPHDYEEDTSTRGDSADSLEKPTDGGDGGDGEATATTPNPVSGAAVFDKETPTTTDSR